MNYFFIQIYLLATKTGFGLSFFCLSTKTEVKDIGNMTTTTLVYLYCIVNEIIKGTVDTNN